ncbi:3133_t:CDS:2 [Dentiscutata erythropus]|uniref:3133_t:CDS:1 n=1 Tax=Dentiscutata erythropus TaxID=1348616 RepID=A0A9N8ZBY9_9GLOM|nr:3133_t:CDS:2 [Dentiscutata erythropus]
MSIAVSITDAPLTPKTSNNTPAPSSTPSTPVIDNIGLQDQDTPGKIVDVKERTPLQELNFNNSVRKDRVISKPRKKHPVKKQNSKNNDQDNMNKISDNHSATEPLRKDLIDDSPIIIVESETSESQAQKKISVRRKSKRLEGDDGEKESTERKKPAKRRKKDKDSPRKPANSYLQFAFLKRSEFVKKNPEMDKHQLDVLLGKTWKSMSKAEKKPYYRMAEEERVRYNEKMQKHNETVKLKECVNSEEQDTTYERVNNEKQNASYERANSEEQDAPYDIDPFPDFQSMLNAPLSFGPFESISQESLDNDFHDQKVNANQHTANSSVSVKYEPLSPTLPDVNNNISNTLSQPIHTYVDRVQQVPLNGQYYSSPMSQRLHKQFQSQSPYTASIKSEFVFVQNNNNSNLAMQQQIPEHIRQPIPRVNQRPHQINSQSQQTSLMPNSLLSHSMSQNVMSQNINRQRQPQHVMPNFSQIWQEQETIAQNMPQQQECLQTQNASSQLTSQQIQIPQQMRYSQQISTIPPPPPTPNMLHTQIPRQINNGLAMQSLNQQQQMEKQLRPAQQQMPYQTWQPVLMYSQDVSRKSSQQMLMSCNMLRQIMPQPMPQQNPQRMMRRPWQTIPSQTNNQFLSYEPTQQFAWQQQPNVAMYNPWNNQQQMSGQIDNQMGSQLQINSQIGWY